MSYKPGFDKYKPYKKRFSGFRVRGPVKSFRDLEVYQKTIQLSDELVNLPFLSEFEDDVKELKLIAQKIPKLIAEAYGDRFDSQELAFNKITEAITLITDVITKIDLFRERFSESKEEKETLDKLLKKYQTQKRKTLNLRKAWQRFSNKFKNN